MAATGCNISSPNLGSGPAATWDRKTRKPSGSGTPRTCPALKSGESSPNELWKWYKMLLLAEDCTWKGQKAPHRALTTKTLGILDFATSSQGKGEFLLQGSGGKHKPVTNYCQMNSARTQEGDKKKWQHSSFLQIQSISSTTRQEEIYSWEWQLLNVLSHPPLLPMAPNFPPGIHHLLSRHVEK